MKLATTTGQFVWFTWFNFLPGAKLRSVSKRSLADSSSAYRSQSMAKRSPKSHNDEYWRCLTPFRIPFCILLLAGGLWESLLRKPNQYNRYTPAHPPLINHFTGTYSHTLLIYIRPGRPGLHGFRHFFMPFKALVQDTTWKKKRSVFWQLGIRGLNGSYPCLYHTPWTRLTLWYIYIYVCVFSPFQEFSIFVIPTWLPFGAAVYVSGIRNSSQYFPFPIFWGDFPGSLAPSEASFQWRQWDR